MNLNENQATPPEAELRMTRQRREVHRVLAARMDHPTAADVHLAVRETMPSISLATVYNCLESMTQCGLIKKVNLDREPSRYCANLSEHAHFFCQKCGVVSDVAVTDAEALREGISLEEGSRVDRLDLSVRGLCPACAAEASVHSTTHA